VIDALQGKRLTGAPQKHNATVSTKTQEGSIDVLQLAGGLDQHVRRPVHGFREELFHIVNVVSPPPGELAAEQEGLDDLDARRPERQAGEHRCEQTDRASPEDQHVLCGSQAGEREGHQATRRGLDARRGPPARVAGSEVAHVVHQLNRQVNNLCEQAIPLHTHKNRVDALVKVPFAARFATVARFQGL
jgi:hypothetical protein